MLKTSNTRLKITLLDRIFTRIAELVEEPPDVQPLYAEGSGPGALTPEEWRAPTIVPR